MNSKPPIPYIPDWKLEKSLKNSLLLYRIFERKSVPGLLFYRNVTRTPWCGQKIWLFLDRIYSFFSNRTRARAIPADKITAWVDKIDKDLDNLVTKHREKVGISKK